jgi:putative transposase
MNRAARRLTLFERAADYDLFCGVLREATDRFSMRLLCYVVMPNHWHLVVWPSADGHLSAFMAWMTAAHVRAWHVRRESVGSGTLYQGRYKAVPVQTDTHLYTVCRYVERNPVRAGLTTRPRDWRWGSAWAEAAPWAPRLSAWPAGRPDNWSDVIDREQPPEELVALRRAIAAGRPLGTRCWALTTAASIRWTRGLRGPGRPRR